MIDIAIFMTTYNHKAYLEQAVESVMMQQLDGAFTLFLGDDCSTDGTTEICKELKSKYPDRIELLFSEYNIGALKNCLRTFAACVASGAAYIAFCEGDDYWTEPNKLQKQVDILEGNNDVGMVISDMDIYHQESGLFEKAILKNGLANINESQPLLSYGYLCAASWLMRTEMLEKALPSLRTATDATLVLYYEITARSKVHVLNEVTAVYRKRLGSASNLKSQHAAFEFLYGVINDQKQFIERHNLSDDHGGSIALARTYLKVFQAGLNVEKQDFIDECLAFFNKHPYHADLSWIVNQNKRLKKSQEDLATLHESKLFKLYNAVVLFLKSIHLLK